MEIRTPFSKAARAERKSPSATYTVASEVNATGGLVRRITDENFEVAFGFCPAVRRDCLGQGAMCRMAVGVALERPFKPVESGGVKFCVPSS